MKKDWKEGLYHRLLLIVVAMQPIIDLDYLLFDFLDQWGLPRPATVVRFLILPALILWGMVKYEKKNKKAWIALVGYGLVLVSYFFLHDRQAASLVEPLWFTSNFVYSRWQELTYVLTLILPFGMVFCLFKDELSLKDLRFLTLFESAVISIPVLLGDLYVFADSTYYGHTVGNIFTWFAGIYNSYHPRTLASKFFFNEGNTIGILLFMLLPLLYYFFSLETEKKKKTWIGALILVQSLAMQMLATRVATYGAVLIPLMFLVLHVFDHFVLSKKKLSRSVLLFCACAAVLTGLILPYTPAIQNQKVDAVNDTALLHNGATQYAVDELASAEDLVPGSEAWINFYVYAFETYGINARMIQSVPSMYYTEYYSYQHDPKFWMDVTMMPVFDRVNGRQIETIFTKYKYQNLSSVQKLLGMGYSTFMNGSIVLERDFVMQIYMLGLVGEVLCVLPWILVVLYGFIMFVRYFKKLFTLENIILVISLGAGFGSAYLSGHMLDQFITTIFTAVLVAVLLNKVKEARKEVL